MINVFVQHKELLFLIVAEIDKKKTERQDEYKTEMREEEAKQKGLHPFETKPRFLSG